MEKDRRKFYFDKSINVTNLMAVLSAVVAIGLWGSRVETRLSLIERAIVAQEKVDYRQDDLARQQYLDIQKRLDAIENKLDRLIEKQAK